MEGGDGGRGWKEEKTFSRRQHGELTMRDRENGWGEASFVVVGGRGEWCVGMRSC